MKKVIFIFLGIILGFNSVDALTIEEDLNNYLNTIPDSYSLTIENRVSTTYTNAYNYETDLIEFYVTNKIRENLDSYTDDFSYTNPLHKYSVSINKLNENKYNVKLSDAGQCYNEQEKYYYTCDETTSVTKDINVSVSYIVDDSHDNEINDIIRELNQIDVFSDFSNHIQTFKISDLTTPNQIKKIEKKYNVNVNYFGFAGNAGSNNDDDIEMSWLKSHIYIIFDNTIYSIKQFDVFKIHKLYNYYYPSLALNKYYDIDMYIEDALKNFPKKAHLNNFEIVPQSNGLNYKKSIIDGVNRYEVSINDLDDEINWIMYFSGDLGEKPSEEDLKGDMNGNGRIDLQDIILLLRKYLGLL